jgi:hypothetical protein
MQFGDPSSFAIQCVHEPIPNEKGWVFGRMCVWADGQRLGDIEEPACMLNVTAFHLSGVVERLPSLEEPAFASLSDTELFELLDRALYEDDDRTLEEVEADAAKFFKFEFLTNGGESFDRSKAFIAGSNGELRLLFKEPLRGLASARVSATGFASTVAAFLAWVQSEGKNAG